jgi:hypothetical protein
VGRQDVRTIREQVYDHQKRGAHLSALLSGQRHHGLQTLIPVSTLQLRTTSVAGKFRAFRCLSFVVSLGILSTAHLSCYSCLIPPGVGFWHEVSIAHSEFLESGLLYRKDCMLTR